MESNSPKDSGFPAQKFSIAYAYLRVTGIKAYSSINYDRTSWPYEFVKQSADSIEQLVYFHGV